MRKFLCQYYLLTVYFDLCIIPQKLASVHITCIRIRLRRYTDLVSYTSNTAAFCYCIHITIWRQCHAMYIQVVYIVVTKTPVVCKRRSKDCVWQISSFIYAQMKVQVQSVWPKIRTLSLHASLLADRTMYKRRTGLLDSIVLCCSHERWLLYIMNTRTGNAGQRHQGRTKMRWGRDLW